MNGPDDVPTATREPTLASQLPLAVGILRELIDDVYHLVDQLERIPVMEDALVVMWRAQIDQVDSSVSMLRRQVARCRSGD